MRRRKKLISQKMIKQGIVGITLSNFLPKIGSKLIGRQFFIKVLSSFLCIGTTLVFFHISGNIPCFNYSSNIIFRGIVTDSLQVCINLIDILSYPCPLLESNDFIIEIYPYLQHEKNLFWW